jgi:hypothetical protein
MKVIFVIVGVILLSLGLTAIPRLVGLIGQEDSSKVMGRATVVAFELAIGGWLLYYGIRSLLRTKKSERH